MNDTARHVSEQDFDHIKRGLEKAQELQDADTSRMTLAEKIEHQRRIKQHMTNARA